MTPLPDPFLMLLPDAFYVVPDGRLGVIDLLSSVAMLFPL
jgi:hypothetical protein